MARDLRSKALGYLRSGAVTVLGANTFAAGPRQPFRVLADVVGHRSTYRVTHWSDHDSGWSCTCRMEGCAHVAAVQLVTGHAGRSRERSDVDASRRA